MHMLRRDREDEQGGEEEHTHLDMRLSPTSNLAPVELWIHHPLLAQGFRN